MPIPTADACLRMGSALLRSLALMVLIDGCGVARAQRLPAAGAELPTGRTFPRADSSEPDYSPGFEVASRGRRSETAQQAMQPFAAQGGVMAAPGDFFDPSVFHAESPLAGLARQYDDCGAFSATAGSPFHQDGEDQAANPGVEGSLAEATSGERAVSFRLLGPNVLEDQKRIWLFPVRVAEGKHWKPALGFVAATAGLVALDPVEAPYFRDTTSFHTFDQAFSGTDTSIGMAAVPTTFFAVALLRHNTYDQHTSLLAGEAVIDSELLAEVLKGTVRRLRPIEVPAGGGFSDTFFDARGGLFNGQAGFPSGHTIAAFSIATVFADRYSRHRWVPWLAYGLATAVGFSRITNRAHFPGDVFAGAVFGYSISHYAVLRR